MGTSNLEEWKLNSKTNSGSVDLILVIDPVGRSVKQTRTVQQNSTQTVWLALLEDESASVRTTALSDYTSEVLNRTTSNVNAIIAQVFAWAMSYTYKLHGIIGNIGRGICNFSVRRFYYYTWLSVVYTKYYTIPAE